MSDLSEPPLQGLPPGADIESGALTGIADAPADAGFAWPAPDAPGYGGAQPLSQPEPCRIEGVKGHVMLGQLIAFDPDRLRAWVRTPAGQKPLVLLFTQFRRLTLSEPLRPAAAEAGHGAAAMHYTLTQPDGKRCDGTTLAPAQRPYGLFLFEPVDGSAWLRRVFVPQAAMASFDLVAPAGELHEPHADALTLGALDDESPTEPMPLDERPRQLDATHDRRVALALEADDGPAQPAGDADRARREPRAEAPAARAADARSAAQAESAQTISLQTVSTPDELDLALAAQSRMPLMRIGEALLSMGFVTPEQLDAALGEQRADNSVPLGELLVRRGVLQRRDLRAALARKMGYPVVDIDAYPIDTTALSRVPHAMAERLRVLPLKLRAGCLVIATEDPSRRQAIDELEFVVQGSVVPVLAQHADLSAAIDRAYDRIGSGRGRTGSSATDELDFEDADASELLATLEQVSNEQREDPDERPIEQSDNSLVRLINQMIVEAQNQGVSDIHVECPPGREKVRIRFRKDGQLRPYLELPPTYRAALLARLKIMCDLDISEKRKPQDGKINFAKFHPGAKLELRLATIPTHSGMEDAVLRLLASAKPLPLDKLGLSPFNLAGLKSVMERPYGMLLCVGPTGSGKTTTLHSALGYINKPDRKIWTAEDPIEITQPGLRQVQVNAKIDWTFAKALRAFLRADPDVVMVGEIRDHETAQMAIEASLTGHLVLSTLHTNSAAETVTRLLDMGMDPFNFADSLLGVLAQRLVRRLCPKCVRTRDATPEEVDEWLGDYLHAFPAPEHAPSRDSVRDGWLTRFGTDGRLKHHHSPGCSACDGGGYRGRAAIQELLLVSREMRRLIQTGSRAEELLAVAQREGLRTLRQDGIEKVIAGITSIEEVRATSNA